MNITLFIPIFRQVLQVIGGALIARGILDAGSNEAFIGLGVNAATLIWWLIDRNRINKKTAILKALAGHS